MDLFSIVVREQALADRPALNIASAPEGVASFIIVSHLNTL